MNEREWIQHRNNDQNTSSSHDESHPQQLQQQLQHYHQQEQQPNNNSHMTSSSTISSLIDGYERSPESTNQIIDHESSTSSSTLEDIYTLQTKARSLPVFSSSIGEYGNDDPRGVDLEKSASWASPHDETNYPAFNYTNGGSDATFDPSQHLHSGLSNQQQFSPRGPWHQTPPQPPKSPSLLFTVSYHLPSFHPLFFF